MIVLIVDGCSSEQYTLARWFKGEPLSFDEAMAGAVKTYTADSVVADSAPAASAFATGYRTNDKFISVGPVEPVISDVDKPAADLQYRPLATVLEGARLMNKATGVVATSSVTHATPAAYVAHLPSRSMEDDIMEQTVYQNIDVVFGGGKQYLLGKEAGGKRADGENLMDVLKGRGYSIVETRDDMMALGSGKAFGMFADSNMEAEIDRPQNAPEQPTLQEMTAKAIELLSRDPDGFFLFVEGSQVDWACHANDPAHLLSDLLAYDKAVKEALDFAKKNGNTVVLAFSDHNTGGMSLGNYATDSTYSQIKPEKLLAPLKGMKASAPAVWKKLGDEKTPEKLKSVVKEYWGFEISNDDAARIIGLSAEYNEDPFYALGEVISARYTFVGWTAHGHVGGDVPLFTFGPNRPTGLLDGPEIGKATASALGVDLNALNQRLFVEASKAFEGGKATLDKSDPGNPVLKVELNGWNAELPVNKNIVKTGERVVELEGVVVYAPKTEKVYVPMQAVQVVKGGKVGLPAVVR